MADYTVKQHDQGTTLEFPLEEFDPDQQAWIPFQGLEVATQIRLLFRSTTAIGPGTPATVVLIIGLASYGGVPGLVTYTTDSDDLAYAGSYAGEIEVTRPGGIVETAPNDSYFTLDVIEHLA